MHRITDFDMEALGRAYLSGQTLADLSSATGVTRGTLYRWLTGAGVPMRPMDPTQPRRERVAVPPSVREELVAGWARGDSQVALSRHTGLSGFVVRRVLREEQVLAQRPPAPDYEHSEIVQLRDHGMTYTEIVNRLGCCKDTVHQALRDAGRTRPGGRPLPPIAELRRHYRRLGSVRKVAAELRVAGNRVADALRGGQAVS